MLSRALPTLLFVAVLTIISVTDAQSRGRRWDMGIHFGPAVAGIYGVDSDSLGSDSRTGFAAGVWGTNWLSENVGVRLELTYAQKGATRGRGDEEVTAKLNYIEIPLLVVFMRELTPKTFFINMHVGPALGFQVSADFDSAGSTVRDLDSITKGVDFSGVLGLGFSYRAAERLDVTLDLRYTVGFVSIDDGPGFVSPDGTISSYDWRNNYFAILLGVQSRLGYW